MAEAWEVFAQSGFEDGNGRAVLGATHVSAAGCVARVVESWARVRTLALRMAPVASLRGGVGRGRGPDMYHLGHISILNRRKDVFYPEYILSSVFLDRLKIPLRL
jgi:hypothetical protein